LSCQITSLHDVESFSTRFYFYVKTIKGTLNSKPSDIIIKGNPEWTGGLHPGKPVEFSNTVKFPKEGKWAIGCNGSADDIQAYGEEIQFSIDRQQSIFGWKPFPSTSKSSGNLSPNIPDDAGPEIIVIVYHQVGDCLRLVLL
jgi:hypothetical protein